MKAKLDALDSKHGCFSSEKKDILIHTVSARFKHVSKGKVELFSDSEAFSYDIQKKYLSVFGDVIFIVRSKKCDCIPTGYYELTGEGISAVPLAYFEGPYQFAKRYLKIRKQLKEIIKRYDCASLIFTLPCPIGMMAINLIEKEKPYGVEVVGDPWDAFSPGAIRHMLRPILRVYSTYRLKKACRNAIAAMYVTEEVLQRRYPCENAMFSASNIHISEEDIRRKPRKISIGGVKNIVFVGSLSQLYKGQDILLKAFKECVASMKDIHLTIIGDGKCRPELERMAKKLGISEKVTFLGAVSRDEVFRKLDEADLFVLPSRAEGLPRAMLEAMARGVPCIGTSVGGIPELLTEEDIVPPGDIRALADKIIDVLNKTETMNDMSIRNIRKAKEFTYAVLQERRESFYALVKKKTDEWVALKRRR